MGEGYRCSGIFTSEPDTSEPPGNPETTISAAQIQPGGCQTSTAACILVKKNTNKLAQPELNSWSLLGISQPAYTAGNLQLLSVQKAGPVPKLFCRNCVSKMSLKKGENWIKAILLISSCPAHLFIQMVNGLHFYSAALSPSTSVPTSGLWSCGLMQESKHDRYTKCPVSSSTLPQIESCSLLALIQKLFVPLYLFYASYHLA